jgi:hypothetical protein
MNSPGPGVAWTIPRPASTSPLATSSTSSSSAWRLGTGRPSAPEWVGDFDVANPSAPARTASATMARMRAVSSAVAARSTASSPST